MVTIFVFMNLEKRFHLFQDFLYEMSNGAISHVRSINLEKLDKPTVRYEGRRSRSDEFFTSSHQFSNFDMLVHVTDYILTIDLIAKCHMDKIWCDELTYMFRGTFSSLLPANCMIVINPLTNELTPTNWYA